MWPCRNSNATVKLVRSPALSDTKWPGHDHDGGDGNTIEVQQQTPGHIVGPPDGATAALASRYFWQVTLRTRVHR